MNIEEIERDFLADIWLQYGTMEGDSNDRAYALFRAIQAAFDGSSITSFVEVSQYLLHNLAVCAWVAMRYDSGKDIPWEQHDWVDQRALRGFLFTVVKAIKEGKTTKNDEGFVLLNRFPVPEWLVEQASNWTSI